MPFCFTIHYYMACLPQSVQIPSYSNVLKISVHTSVLFAMYLLLKKNPLTFTDSSSTKHLRKYFSSDAFIHRIKNMQIFKPSSASHIPCLLAGKLQSSDGNFTLYYFLLEVCCTNVIFTPIPVSPSPPSEFHCGMSTLSKILQPFYIILKND